MAFDYTILSLIADLLVKDFNSFIKAPVCSYKINYSIIVLLVLTIMLVSLVFFVHVQCK